MIDVTFICEYVVFCENHIDERSQSHGAAQKVNLGCSWFMSGNPEKAPRARDGRLLQGAST